jgi:GWxTD domain-containing protein
MRIALLIVVVTLLAVPAWADQVDPAVELVQARTLIEARKYADALVRLDSARGAVATLPEGDRDAALAAIHFYSALAEFEMGNEPKTREHLATFIELSPNARVNDTKRYPKRFVSLFNDVHSRETKNVVTFEKFYPGFDPRLDVAPAWEADASSWGSSPALELLASRAEKRAWNDILPPADRKTFIDNFWKQRDPSPETDVNEARDIFDRRVAFADRTFAAEGLRGSLTDRGRIFVLLGAPSMVQRRPLMNRDNVQVTHEMVNGTMELWVYSREQLPIDIPKRAVQYRFVTQKEFGEGILQRAEEAYATQVLAAAGQKIVQ